MSMNDMSHNRDLILIIDDDFINREILKNIFAENFGFLEAENGREGLRMFEQHEKELCAILLDVQMPVMNGMELLEVLQGWHVPEQIPVFLITANDELELAKSAYDMGVMGVINKPIVPFIVERRVLTVVELYRARKALSAKVEDQAQTIQENVETIDALHRNTLEVLASAIEFRDVESGEHTNRIYGITRHILMHTDMGAGYTDEELENMAVGAIMHDIGKIAISDVILNKPGRLTKAEYEIMKTHTIKGAAQLERLIRLQSHPSYTYALDIARHHHERWDGSGYPDGLKGNEITVWTQVTSIADVYDALVNPRLYKKALAPEQAVEMIARGDCGAFNPELVACFRQVEPELRKLYVADDHPGTPAIQAADSSEELMDVLLISAVVQQTYEMIVSANLTQNRFHIIRDDNGLIQELPPSGTLDDLIEAYEDSIPEVCIQEYRARFNREALKTVHLSGNKSVDMEYVHYAEDGQHETFTLAVYFIDDPGNDDIHAIFLVHRR